jgi:hypothetical protein
MNELLDMGWTALEFDREYYSLHHDMYEWACDNISENGGGGVARGWTVYMVFGKQFWFFEKREAALMFKLTWGGVK